MILRILFILIINDKLNYSKFCNEFFDNLPIARILVFLNCRNYVSRQRHEELG